MWYVIPHKKSIAEHLATQPTPFYNFGEARDKAEYLRGETGAHYHVVKIQTVWTTTTLADLLNEKGERALAEFNKKNPTP